jgi:hypothetical protein
MGDWTRLSFSFSPTIGLPFLFFEFITPETILARSMLFKTTVINRALLFFLCLSRDFFYLLSLFKITAFYAKTKLQTYLGLTPTLLGLISSCEYPKLQKTKKTKLQSKCVINTQERSVFSTQNKIIVYKC